MLLGLAASRMSYHSHPVFRVSQPGSLTVGSPKFSQHMLIKLGLLLNRAKVSWAGTVLVARSGGAGLR